MIYKSVFVGLKQRIRKKPFTVFKCYSNYVFVYNLDIISVVRYFDKIRDVSDECENLSIYENEKYPFLDRKRILTKKEIIEVIKKSTKIDDETKCYLGKEYNIESLLIFCESSYPL